MKEGMPFGGKKSLKDRVLKSPFARKAVMAGAVLGMFGAGALAEGAPKEVAGMGQKAGDRRVPPKPESHESIINSFYKAVRDAFYKLESYYNLDLRHGKYLSWEDEFDPILSAVKTAESKAIKVLRSNKATEEEKTDAQNVIDAVEHLVNQMHVLGGVGIGAGRKVFGDSSFKEALEVLKKFEKSNGK